MVGKLNDLHILHDFFWFYSYTLVMAECYLLFFVLSKNNAATSQEEYAAALRAHHVLGVLALNNPAARTCHGLLSDLLATLPLP